MRTALREAGMLLFAATALGLIYTAATEKGIFRPQRGSSATVLPSGPSAPAMISREEAKALFDSGNVLFIDSRHEYDYRLGHIRGAINLPLNDYDTRKAVLAQVPKNRQVVIYCDSAECNSSIELSAKLFLDGFTSVKIFFGGWGEWRAMNLPVEVSTQ